MTKNLMKDGEYAKNFMLTGWVIDTNFVLWTEEALPDDQFQFNELGLCVEIRHAAGLKLSKKKYDILKVVVTDSDLGDESVKVFFLEINHMRVDQEQCHKEIRGVRKMELEFAKEACKLILHYMLIVKQ
jgi:hypothetical protein